MKLYDLPAGLAHTSANVFASALLVTTKHGTLPRSDERNEDGRSPVPEKISLLCLQLHKVAKKKVFLIIRQKKQRR